MKNKNKLTPSLENYLEAILFIETKNRVARVKDIADFLKVQMSSVTVALKNLREKGLVNYEKNSFVVLSDKGKLIAGNTQKKHDIIRNFLENILKIQAEDADRAACEIEHILDLESASRLANCSDFVIEKLKESGLSEQEWKTILKKKANP